MVGQEDSEVHGEEIQHKNVRINVAFERHEASGKIGIRWTFRNNQDQMLLTVSEV